MCEAPDETGHTAAVDERLDPFQEFIQIILLSSQVPLSATPRCLLLPSGIFLRRLMKPFENPLPENRRFFYTFGLRDLLYVLNLTPGQVDAQRCTLRTDKHRLADLLQSRFEVCHIVGVPESGQLLNGVCFGQPLLLHTFILPSPDSYGTVGGTALPIARGIPL